MQQITVDEFKRAMRLLGLDPDDPDRAIVSVSIRDGLIRAELAMVRRLTYPVQPGSSEEDFVRIGPGIPQI